MNSLERILIKLGLYKMKPHEKAALGLGNWGRQPGSEPVGALPAKARPGATMTTRVYRAATDTWEEN